MFLWLSLGVDFPQYSIVDTTTPGSCQQRRVGGDTKNAPPLTQQARGGAPRVRRLATPLTPFGNGEPSQDPIPSGPSRILSVEHGHQMFFPPSGAVGLRQPGHADARARPLACACGLASRRRWRPRGPCDQQTLAATQSTFRLGGSWVTCRVHEPRVVQLVTQPDSPGAAAAVLRDDQLSLPRGVVRVVQVTPVQQHDHVCVLLQRAGLP